MTKRSEFPPGWDQARVHEVLEHYVKQTSREAAAEHAAALAHPDSALMVVPIELVPAVQRLLAEHKRKKD
jgi:hypothetical protein